MKHYETTILMRSEDDVGIFVSLIEELGGQITSHDDLGRRRLAYPIKKETSAVYGVWEFDLEPTKLIELNKKLRSNEAVLRHLIIAGGIRAPKSSAKKLSAKDLEVPESLTKGMAELAQAAATPETTEGKEHKPETREKTQSPAKKKKVAKAEPLPDAAEELTAKERQKKLDEKLKSILGE